MKDDGYRGGRSSRESDGYRGGRSSRESDGYRDGRSSRESDGYRDGHSSRESDGYRGGRGYREDDAYPDDEPYYDDEDYYYDGQDDDPYSEDRYEGSRQGYEERRYSGQGDYGRDDYEEEPDSRQEKSSSHFIKGRKNGSGSGSCGGYTAPRNKEFAVVTYIFLFIFLAWIAYFVYFMVFRSESIINNSYNGRTSAYSKLVNRGSILAADGTVLAQSQTDSDGNSERSYPYANEFAHVVGYTIQGSSGVESMANFYMLRSHASFPEQLQDQLTGNKVQGDSVVTTLDVSLQEAAYNALGSQDGAVVAIDPQSGKVLAMVSKPDFDPNTLASDWDYLTSDSSTSSVLVNRATQGQYPPGSIFKVFATVEYLREHNMDDSGYSFTCTGSLTEGDYTIHCYHNTVHGTVGLAESFADSCNTSYANIGLSLDKASYISLVDNCLFNTTLPTEIPCKSSSFVMTEDAGTSEVMQTVIGQGQTVVTPMHMAMIASAIANDGVLIRPYLLLKVQNDAGITVKKFSTSEYGSLFSSEEASKLQEYMQDTVEEGTAQSLSGQSYNAYGKTGTAEVSDSSSSKPDAWFMGYAEYNGKKIAVAVVVENSGSGSTYAVPVAKSIFDTWVSGQ